MAMEACTPEADEPEQEERKFSSRQRALIYLLYGASFLVWIGYWAIIFGMESIVSTNFWPKAESAAFFLAFLVLGANLVLWYVSKTYGDMNTEIKRIEEVETYSSYIVSGVVGTLLAATAIPSALDVPSPPPEFALFEAHALLWAILVLSLYWIPHERPDWLAMLRHAKTIGFTYAIFLFLYGLLLLLSWMGSILSP